jgi:hypothetical protein
MAKLEFAGGAGVGRVMVAPAAGLRRWMLVVPGVVGAWGAENPAMPGGVGRTLGWKSASSSWVPLRNSWVPLRSSWIRACGGR